MGKLTAPAIFLFLIPMLLLSGCTSQFAQPSSASSQPLSASPSSQAFESSSLLELMQKNTPFECSIRMDYQGQAVFSTIYILGQNYRYIAPLPSFGAAGELEMVFKNNSLYTKLPSSLSPLGCSWIRTDISLSETAPPATLPGASFSCKPGSFQAGIFETEGKICSDSDLPAIPATR